MKKRLGIASGDRIPPHSAVDQQPHWGGAGWVRLGQYENHLDFDVVIGTLVWNKDHFSIGSDKQMFDQTSTDLQEVDIIILQRLMHDTLPMHIKMARDYGQVVLNDLDDWYWGLSTSNQAYLASHPKINPNENVNHYKTVLNAGNAIMVSTPYLRDRLKQMLGTCPPIEILYNTVDVARFNVHEQTDEVPTVGWVGSTRHRSNDLETLKGVLTPLQKQGLIQLQHSGHVDGAPTFAEALGAVETDVIKLPMADAKDYPKLLTMDIGIAPLSDVPFNHAKSDIKLLEYSASGIPWIASALPSYEALQKLWGLGRIAKKNKPVSWQNHAKELCNYKVRVEEGSALREAVWSRDIHAGADLLNQYLHSFF